MQVRICNGCKVMLDDGGEYYTFQMYHMERDGVIEESERVRDLCLKCEAILRKAIDIIDAGTKP